jgi:hypothetical protein
MIENDTSLEVVSIASWEVRKWMERNVIWLPVMIPLAILA